MYKRFIHFAAALFIAHTCLACVEVVDVSPYDIASQLRTSPERMSVPRPVEGQTWLVTTEYSPESNGLDSGTWALQNDGRQSLLVLHGSDLDRHLGQNRSEVDPSRAIPDHQVDSGRQAPVHGDNPQAPGCDVYPRIPDGGPEVTLIEASPALELAASSSTPPPTSGALASPVSSSWSDHITWEFRVLDADFVPDQGSSFYSLTLGEDGLPERATLLEAAVLGEHTRDSAAKLLAPVFLLVLRRSDYRLLGLQVSYRQDGRRQTEIIDLSVPGPVALPPALEQSHIVLDFVLPEFPLDSNRHDEMTVEVIAGGGVEVAFTSIIDGSLVVQRWDAGQPWFTQSRSDDRTSWLGTAR